MGYRSVFLDKTYFDVVSASGDWAIAYDARMPLKGLALAYRELTTSDQPHAPGRFSLETQHRTASTVFSNGKGRSVTWDVCAPTPPLVLETAALRWELEGLRGSTQIQTPSGSWRGSGYRERVVLKKPPWRLGLRRLSWGRFISDESFVTWIVSTGADPIRFGVLDRSTTNAVEVDGQVVRVGPATLALQERLALVTDTSPFSHHSRGLRALATLTGAGRFDLRQLKEVRACTLNVPGRQEWGVAMVEEVVFGSDGGQAGEPPA